MQAAATTRGLTCGDADCMLTVTHCFLKAVLVCAAALNQLTKNLCCEWGPDGIRVNAVSPYYITTPLTEQVLTGQFLDLVKSRCASKRVGSPEEVSGETIPSGLQFWCV